MLTKVKLCTETTVMKRDGCQVNFDENRIRDAVRKAAQAVNIDDEDYCAYVARVVSDKMAENPTVDISEIQMSVENQLMAGPYKEIARAYIEYRHDRDISREKRSSLSQDVLGLMEQAKT